MRIAQVSPLYESVPPLGYGGTERVVSYLTEELVRQGHEVTLFASGDSQTTAKLIPACPRALWRDTHCFDTSEHDRMMDLIFSDLSRFDVIHFHCDRLHFPLLRRHSCCSITTLHRHMDDGVLKLHDEYPEVPMVSISADQRRSIPGANWQATIHHGLPLDLHTFREQPGDYLVFLGRISPDKRPDRAIAIAARAGMRLKIAARITPGGHDYYEQVVAPLIHENRHIVELVGEVGGAAKDELLGGARAMLFPIDWQEPFGLVMIEAMACGTPVIAYPHGSVPEVVEDGVTGYLVDSIEDAAAAVMRVAEIDRRACRRAFVERFSAGRMVQDYLAVYQRMLDARSFPEDSVRRCG